MLISFYLQYLMLHYFQFVNYVSLQYNYCMCYHLFIIPNDQYVHQDQHFLHCLLLHPLLQLILLHICLLDLLLYLEFSSFTVLIKQSPIQMALQELTHLNLFFIDYHEEYYHPNLGKHYHNIRMFTNHPIENLRALV